MARKPASKSSNSQSRKKAVHPQRTGIVWSVFVGSMALVAGALVLSSGWKPVALTSIGSFGAEVAPVPVKAGRWKAIVIHHSGKLTGSADELTRQHKQWGLPSLGFHFVIGNGSGDHDGAVIRGSRWMQQLGGAHLPEQARAGALDAQWLNENTIGICLIGNGERGEFTDAQMHALEGLVRQLEKDCGIPSNQVYLASQLAPVASPGRNFPQLSFAEDIRN